MSCTNLELIDVWSILIDVSLLCRRVASYEIRRVLLMSQRDLLARMWQTDDEYSQLSSRYCEVRQQKEDCLRLLNEKKKEVCGE